MKRKKILCALLSMALLLSGCSLQKSQDDGASRETDPAQEEIQSSVEIRPSAESQRSEEELARQAADEVLASMPYYGDISSCGMTADQATLLAMLIAQGIRGDVPPYSGYGEPVDEVVFWGEPYTVWGYDGYYQTDRARMVIGDFSGEGTPYLYCFSSLVTDSFEVYGWDQFGQPERVIGEEAYGGRQGSYLFETATGKINVSRSGSSGADSHSGEVYAFLQGQAMVSQTWSEEYDYEEDVWKVRENGVTSYYTPQEWEAMNSGEDASPQPERNLPWRSFEEVVADACTPVEMLAYLNDYIAALSGKTSATIFVSEITDEQRMAKEYYNLMAELEETESLAWLGDQEISEPNFRMDYARLFDMDGDGVPELILSQQEEWGLYRALLVHWSDGQLRITDGGQSIEGGQWLVREKSSGAYAVWTEETMSSSYSIYAFSDHTDTIGVNVSDGYFEDPDAAAQAGAEYQAKQAEYEVVEEISPNEDLIEETRDELLDLIWPRS